MSASAKPPVRTLAVIVPARDEEQTIRDCLESIEHAAAHPGLRGLSVTVLVVLDDCVDRTGSVCADVGVDTLAIAARNVGASRNAGFTTMLERAVPADPGEIWLATTDADSQVAPDWLAVQREFADAGADAVLGVVDVLDWSGHPPGTAERFRAAYAANIRGRAHFHVHGACLGIRGSAYVQTGGFPALENGEDHGLVAALLSRGDLSVVRSTSLRVHTSGRRMSRVSAGFARDLRQHGIAAATA